MLQPREQPVQDSKEEFGSEIEKRVLKVIVEHFHVDVDKVHKPSHFVDDLGATLTDTVKLVLAFKKEFSVEIPDYYADRLCTSTVGDTIDYLMALSR
jgi:acyl carrier protein